MVLSYRPTQEMPPIFIIHCWHEAPSCSFLQITRRLVSQNSVRRSLASCWKNIFPSLTDPKTSTIHLHRTRIKAIKKSAAMARKPLISSLLPLLLTLSALTTTLASPLDPGARNTTFERLTPNGCGPTGLSDLVPEYRFHDCCNAHDDCWDADPCSKAALRKCNRAFRTCMLDVCDNEIGAGGNEYPKCQKTANTYFEWVDNKMALGWQKLKDWDCWF